ncbi:unnamed protein product [Owenia fusiformis]|uniref:Uncharacterized protein n=1 Tax=Owenia fusiformis TaxID=6347 RepID=A0A8J1TYP9_OWEFU|nr:unnamed protein product [Owenia fusiformis]
MNTFVILAILVAGAYCDLNQVADLDGTLSDCEFVVSPTDCCSFRRYDANVTEEDFGKCPGGTAWIQTICGCDFVDVAICDCPSEPFEPIFDKICNDQAALDASGGCCQNNRVYYAVDGASSNFTFGGNMVQCHPVMTFNLDKCGCVGDATAEDDVTDTPSGPP